jgi:hypothetical protein
MSAESITRTGDVERGIHPNLTVSTGSGSDPIIRELCDDPSLSLRVSDTLQAYNRIIRSIARLQTLQK